MTQASTSTGALVKNNIFYTGGYASVDASSESPDGVRLHRLFFSFGRHAVQLGRDGVHARGMAGRELRRTRILSVWILGWRMLRRCLLTGDYALLAASLASGHWVNLGSAYQMGLSPAALWPGGVSLVNQNSARGAAGKSAGMFIPRAGLRPRCCSAGVAIRKGSLGRSIDPGFRLQPGTLLRSTTD